MAIPDDVFLLCDAIKKKAGKEADEILADARGQAEEIRRGAGEEVKRRLGRWKERERMAAFKQARQVIDAAELRARKLVMSARERLLSEIREEAKKRLLELVDSREYPQVFKMTASRAVAALPGDRVLLQVGPRDLQRVTAGFLEELSRTTGKEVRLLEETADIAGGCIAFSEDRKVLADFSFGALLEREQSRLKRLLAEKILDAGAPSGPSGEAE